MPSLCSGRFALRALRFTFLNAQSAPSMFKFDLGYVFDVDLEKEALVEACGIPRKSGFPTVEVPVEGEVLGREASIG